MDARNPDADVEHYGAFIPLTCRGVAAHLTARAGDRHQRAAFARMATALRIARHRQYLAVAEELRHAYLPFNPDRDTVRELDLSPGEIEARRRTFAERMRRLLARANYVLLSEADINRILTSSHPFSLRVSVDLSEFENFALFYRDVYDETLEFRRPDRLYLVRASVRVTSFRRLFLFLKLKPAERRVAELMERHGWSERRARRAVERRRRFLPRGTSSDFIYVKLFKTIPEYDVQILFPNRKVEFRPFDKIKFGVTAGGGTIFGLVSTSGKLAAATSPFAIAGAMAGFIMLVTRQVTKFFNQRTRYMAELSQKLFFHNLANNSAAIALMLDRAEEEEFKEDLFALAALAGRTVPPEALAAARASVEQDILSTFRAGVSFEIEDALSRLEADGVARRLPDGSVAVEPVERVEAILRALVDALDDAEARRAEAGADDGDPALRTV